MSAAREGFPWRRAMLQGLGRLRLAPGHFWSLTPRELAAALGAGEAPLARVELETLMKEYPDG